MFCNLEFAKKTPKLVPFHYFIKVEPNRKIKKTKLMKSTKSFTKFAAQNLNSIK